MTITLTKTKFAMAVLAVSLIAPATAWATHTFTDVDDNRFYSDAVDWALLNKVTTGTSATTFEPDRGVTRGEVVTFLKRYHDELAQPADAANAAGVAANSAAGAGLKAATPFAVTAFESGPPGGDDAVDTPAAYLEVSVMAPVDGHVTVHSTAVVEASFDRLVGCAIVESTVPPFVLRTDESAQFHSNGSVAGTRSFAITGGATVEYKLVCQQPEDSGTVYGRSLTAIFTPAP